MGSIHIVKASAGSGKTFQLTYEYIARVIETPGLYRNILAVTFTNKATEEMKQRIVSKLNELAQGCPNEYVPMLEKRLHYTPELIRQRAADARTKILHDYSHFNILTIDKFFQRIIRAFLKELDIDANFALELQTDSLLDNAIDRLIEKIADDKALRRWITAFAEENIENNNSWDLRTKIRNLGVKLFTEQYKSLPEACPKETILETIREAQKKDRALLQRWKQLGDEALKIIADHGLSCDDFSYRSGGFSGYLIKASQGKFDAYGPRVTDALASDEKWYKKTSPRKTDIQAIIPLVRPLLESLCKLYDDNYRFHNTLVQIQQNYRSLALLTDLSAEIDKICQEQGIMPISETNGLLNRLISGNDTPFIYEKAGNTYSHFMIDEFQDTSQQQWKNFLPLLDNALAQDDRSPVLLVGDVKQSIYRWRGGDWRILGHDVNQHFREILDQTLEVNYRSTGIIVHFNNEIIDACVQRDNENLNALIATGYDNGSLTNSTRTELQDMLINAYHEHKQQGHKALNEGYVRITSFNKDFNEEETDKAPVIATIEELQQRGYAPGDIAILVRSNHDGTEIAKQLLTYKTAHPESPYCYDLVTQEALTIGNAPIATFIIVAFKLASVPDDSIRLALYNQYLNRDFDTPLPDEERTFLQNLRLKGIEEAFEEVVLHYQLQEHAEDIAYIQAIQEMVHTFSTSKIADLPLFVKWWDETGHSKSINLPQNQQAITIITIHKAKGLQYKAVIVPKCAWNLTPKSTLLWASTQASSFDALGAVPISYRKDLINTYFSEDYYRETVLTHIDNINIFYVAITRAEEELHLMFKHDDRSTKDSINDLLDSILSNSRTDDQSTIKLGEIEGVVKELEDREIYEFGTPFHKQPEAIVPVQSSSYPVHRPDTKLRFKLATQRYFDEGKKIPLAPRNYGILMHKVFENIKHEGEIDAQLALLRANGTLTDEEAQHLHDTITDAFTNPLIRSWFDPKWDTVRTEAEIVVPNDKSTLKRPDRVVTKGAEAVVIDYKFGSNKEKLHYMQIKSYMKLLRRMGYKSVRGYLWYVELNEVETVEADQTFTTIKS